MAGAIFLLFGGLTSAGAVGAPHYPSSRGVGTGPSPNPILRLGQTIDYPDVNLILDPPPDGLEPVVDAEDALATASTHSNFGGGTSVQPMFALLTSDPLGYKEAPVWVIAFEGVCVPVIGAAADPTAQCAGTTWNSLVDSTTGEWIAAFSDGT